MQIARKTVLFISYQAAGTRGDRIIKGEHEINTWTRDARMMLKFKQ